jgi:hypothetical protein
MDLNKLNDDIYKKKKKLKEKTERYENTYKERFLKTYLEENELRVANGLIPLETEKEIHEWAEYPLIPLKLEIMDLHTEIDYCSYKLDIMLKA